MAYGSPGRSTQASGAAGGPLNIVLLPCLSDADVRRFKRMADLLRLYPRPHCRSLFLVIDSGAAGADELRIACQAVAEACVLPCSISDEDAATDCFWRVAEHVASTYGDDGGFMLWMASDMCPVEPDWLDRLDREWRLHAPQLVIGRHVQQDSPDLDCSTVPEHISCGACYSKRLASEAPREARGGSPFDVALFPMLQRLKDQHGGECWRATSQFAFGSRQTIEDQVRSPAVSVVRGLSDDADAFVDASVQLQAEGLPASDPPRGVFEGLHLCFSVYGPSLKYSRGAVHNAVLAKQVYPGAVVRIYYSSTANHEDIDRLRELGCQMIDMSDSDLPGMYWRFAASDDPRVERWASRDADARLSPREAAAVSDWIDSGRELHIMRDHPCHCFPILGGMFGVFGKRFRLSESLRAWAPRPEYGHDQSFLAARLLPRLRHSALAHDDLIVSGTFGLPTRPFPTPREARDYVGSIYDELDAPHEISINELTTHFARG